MITSLSGKKPWGLHGREAEIARMRDEQGLTFEAIAVAVGATKQGVQGAYKRHKEKQTPAPDSDRGGFADPSEDSSASATGTHCDTQGDAA